MKKVKRFVPRLRGPVRKRRKRKRKRERERHREQKIGKNQGKQLVRDCCRLVDL